VDADVPRIDLADLVTDEAARRDRAAAALRAGFGGLGLVAVAGHDVTDAAVDALHDAFLAVTALPDEVKRRRHRPDLWHQRGWTPPNTERAVVGGGRPDFKECWFAAPLPVDPEAAAWWPELFPENVWPDDGGRLEAELIPVGRGLHAVGRRLLLGCDRALGLDEGTFDAIVEGAAHVTRVLRYLPVDADTAAADVLWGEEHTDFNLLTVLGGGRFLDPHGRVAPRPDDRAGLWLRTRATPEHPRGRRLRGLAPSGHLVAQVGQQLEILTGGVFQATPHGVRTPTTPGWSRTSIAHFVHAHALRPLAPLPPFRTPEALAAYRPPVLAGTYALKTLVDVGLAPPSALDALGFRQDARLAALRADEAEG
jgi:isopenicillin N synthase-like dioxygenase